MEHFVERFLTLDDNGRLWKDEVYRRILDENDITDLDAQTLVDEYLADFNRHCIGFLICAQCWDGKAAVGAAPVSSPMAYPFQQRKLRGVERSGFLRHRGRSGAEQIRKPDPEIFHRARTYRRAAQIYRLRGRQPRCRHPRRAKCGHARCLKRNFYWPTCPHADAVIDNLRDLPPLLHTWQNG
ncbi:MAG: hypothetical protein R2856_27185 [Caldilineaceae bacterium]